MSTQKRITKGILGAILLFVFAVLVALLAIPIGKSAQAASMDVINFNGYNGSTYYWSGKFYFEYSDSATKTTYDGKTVFTSLPKISGSDFAFAIRIATTDGKNILPSINGTIKYSLYRREYVLGLVELEGYIFTDREAYFSVGASNNSSTSGNTSWVSGGYFDSAYYRLEYSYTSSRGSFSDSGSGSYEFYVCQGTASGSILLSNGGSVGNYTNDTFRYKVYDPIGIFSCEYKTPTNSNWQAYSNETTINNPSQGTYTFRNKNVTGTYSAEKSIVFDSVSPSFSLNAFYKSSDTITANITETNMSAWYLDGTWQSSSKSISLAVSGLGEGSHTIRVADLAGNETSKSFTVDKTLPTLSTGTGGVANNGYTKAAFTITVTDTNHDRLYQKFNTSSLMTCNTTNADKSVTDKTITIAATAADGWYSFIAVDKAGNVSAVYSVCLDKTAPTLSATNAIYAAGQTVTATITEANISKWYLDGVDKGSGKSISLTVNDLTDGTHTIKIVDLANNETSRTFISDKTAPTIKYTNSSGATIADYFNASFTFKSADACTGIAKIVYRRQTEKNGAWSAWTDVSSSEKTIDYDAKNFGTWEFYAVDVATNKSATVSMVLSEKLTTFGNAAEIRRGYKVTSWYKVTLPTRVFYALGNDSSGTYTFVDYETALAFATSKERAYRVTAVAGGWIYVNINNEGISQHYTDKTLLDAAVLKYAKTYVSSEQRLGESASRNNYYTTATANGTDADALNAQSIAPPTFLSSYKLSLLRVQKTFKFTAPQRSYATVPYSVTVRMIANDLGLVNADAVSVQVGQYLSLFASEQGYYLVTESDVAGNVEEYLIYIDYTPPSLQAVSSRGDRADELTNFDKLFVDEFAGTLYYTSLKLVAMLDNDPLLCIRIQGKSYDEVFLHTEALPTLGGSLNGSFTITLYDRSYNVLTFTVMIAGAEPYISYSSLKSDIKCTITVNLPGTGNAVTALSLWKIGYDGGYTQIEVDGNGTPVDYATLQYVLYIGGKYVVRITDLFGRTVETTPIFYLKGLPYGTLQGAVDGGVTNKNVTLSYSSSDALVIYVVSDDGSKAPFLGYTTSINPVTGTYAATIAADESTSATYLFFLYNQTDMNLFIEYAVTIDCILAEFQIVANDGAAIEPDTATNKAFRLSWAEQGVIIYYYTSKSGIRNQTRYVLGAYLSENVIYYFSIRDAVGNTLDFTVTYDDYIPYSVDGEYKVVSTDYLLAKNSLIITALEQCSWVCTFGDGSAVPSGGVLNKHGIYTILAVDWLGNVLSLTVEIDLEPPVITLQGVINDGTTKGDVTVKIEGFVLAYLADARGKQIEVVLANATFTAEGEYRIHAFDTAGNRAVAVFTIDKSVKFTSSAKDGLVTTAAVTVSFDEDVSQTVTRDGKNVAAEKKYSTAGAYVIEATDNVGNTVLFTFEILPTKVKALYLTPPEGYLVLSVTCNNAALELEDGAAALTESGKYTVTLRHVEYGENFIFDVTVDASRPEVKLLTKNGVVSFSGLTKKDVTATLYRNGVAVNGFTLSQSVKEKGDYRLVLVDALGNENEYVFVVTTRLGAGSIVGIVVGSLALVGVTIFGIRSRKFKAH